EFANYEKEDINLEERKKHAISKQKKATIAILHVLGNTLVAKDLTQARGLVIEQSDAMSGGGHKVSKSAMSSRFTSEVTSETIAKLEKDRVHFEMQCKRTLDL
ncbi:8741_t:CDS:2, partial [Funneliformis mosseae]